MSYEIPEHMHVRRLNGGRTLYAEGPAGKFAFQEIQFSGGSWWYSNYQPARTLEFIGTANTEVLELYSCMKNHFDSEWDGIGIASSQEYQVGLGYVPFVNNKATLKAGIVYETMDLHPNPDWLMKLCDGIPGKVDQFLDHISGHKKPMHIEGVFKITPFMRSILQQIWDPSCLPAHLDHFRELQTESYLIQALRQMSPQKPEESSVKSNHRAAEIMEVIKTTLNEPLTIKEISRKVGMNMLSTQQVFKARYGETIDDFSRRMRVELAQEFLRDTQDSLLEIARETGYNDASALTRAFKQICGCTPGEYRKSFQG